MKKHSFIYLLFLLSFVISGCGKANPTSSNTPPTQTVIATVEQSAFTVSLNSVDQGTKYNSGYLEYLSFASGGTVINEEGYLRFLMPQIPSGASIESASLNIYITTFDASCTTNVTQVTSTWQKTGISVTNEPTLGPVRANIISTVTGWNFFDVTSLVRDWTDGSAVNFGVRIFPYVTSGPSTDNLTKFQDYNDPQNYPRITIVYQ
jgi:TGF-beta propeptide